MRDVFQFLRIVLLSGLCGCALVNALAQSPICPPRPLSGTLVVNPLDLYSQNGVLNLDLTLQNAQGTDGYMHYCYVYLYQGQPIEAPTLRLNPGDQLILNLTNNIQAPYDRYPARMKMRMQDLHPGSAHKAGAPDDPCEGGVMGPSTTNLHFHGLNIPPTCHQDEVIKTLIQSGDPPFQFNTQIPANDAPGMYWYHPHPHGFSTTQVNGGASGALMIEGSNPLTDGLTEHVIVIRQEFQNANSWLPGPNLLTVNFQPAIQGLQLPFINAQPGKKEFWRVLNASTQAFLALQIQYAGNAQPLEVIALDGIPLQAPTNYKTINVPPAGRVEFIVPPLPSGTQGVFLTKGFDTGPVGNPNPPGPLADIKPSMDRIQSKPASRRPAPTPIGTKRFAGLRFLTPTAQRSLYFSEETIGSNGPTSYFITVQGQRPHVFHMDDPPAITTKIGAVEDWTVENRAGEAHAFHIHQLHFLVTAINGVPVPNPDLLDTITIPAWSGSGPYPNVTLRMDFRDPNIAGTFVYHCHILDHEDGGMMAKIQVNPAN